jgi:hypothetical protein
MHYTLHNKDSITRRVQLRTTAAAAAAAAAEVAAGAVSMLWCVVEGGRELRKLDSAALHEEPLISLMSCNM